MYANYMVKSVYNPIHILHNAASIAPDILARCFMGDLLHNVNVF